MGMIENYQVDELVLICVVVWKWIWDYVQDYLFGGGFDVYCGNLICYCICVVQIDGNFIEVESFEVVDKVCVYYLSYFEMLGEQGWFGFLLWIWLYLLGIWQMECLCCCWKDCIGLGQ